ncbi:hypothetical protein DH2020_042464 [Rehmannia glutinosa]|uniref:Uncharacterized protein n=1 Tax=Rehmannia glutinosa TaxID=99300 RepID=A0ABR0UPC9_REHGL
MNKTQQRRSPSLRNPRKGGAAAAGQKEEAGEEECRDLQDLHLQGAKTVHRYLEQGHGYYEQLHKRYLLEIGAGDFAASVIEQGTENYFSRDPDDYETGVARGAGQACGF